MRFARRVRRQPVLVAALFVAVGVLLGGAFWAVRSGLVFRPALRIQSMAPPSGSEVGLAFPFVGTASDRLARATVAGQPARCEGPTFSRRLELKPGRNVVTVRIESAEGRAHEEDVVYVVDATPPELAGLTPADGAAVGKNVRLEGAANELLSRVAVNGRPARIVDGRRFEIDLAVPKEGLTADLELEDVHGNVATKKRLTWRRETTRPTFLRTSPASGDLVSESSIEVTGIADEPLARVTVNGQAATIDGASFRHRVPLRSGENRLLLVATDEFDNERSSTIRVVLSAVTFTPPSRTTTKEPNIEVRCSAREPITFVRVDDEQLPVPVGAREVTFTLPSKPGAALEEGENTFTVRVGLEGTTLDPLTFSVFRRALGPDLTFSPPSGTRVDDPVVVVRGTASHPLRSLTIGGRTAAITGNAFEAELTVLSEDDVEVVAVDVDGVETRTRYQVELAGWNPGATMDPGGAIPLDLAWLPALFDVTSALDAPKKPSTSRPAAARRGPPRRKTLAEERMERRKNFGQDTEKAVVAGLDWLKRHQHPDGLWRAADFSASCDPNGPKCDGSGKVVNDVGVSGLALLAFLGAGYDHLTTSPNQETVSRGLKALIESQDPQGCFRARRTGVVKQSFYNHAAATMAVAEAMQGSKRPNLYVALKNAVSFILASQNPYKAWRYPTEPGVNDTSATVWMLLALRAAHDAGVEVADAPVGWGLGFLGEMTDDDTGRVGYVRKGEPPVRGDGDKQKWPPDLSESLTAAAMCARIAWEQEESMPYINAGVALLRMKPPRWDLGRGSIDMYYWYYGTRAMLEAGDDDWRRWWRALKEVVAFQSADSCSRGSFGPHDPWGGEGGRVYSTAMMVLALETPYRYPRRRGSTK